ncbi:MAG: protease modulator HflC [Maricaulaceae bacterium]
MNRILLILGVLILGGGFIAASQALYTVNQVEQALVLRLGEPVNVVNPTGSNDPGLKVKVPFVEQVLRFDKRNLELDIEPKEVLAAGQERFVVDAFARYRITDPLRYFQTVRNEIGVRQRLEPIMENSLRGVLGAVPSRDIISGRRAELMLQIRDRANALAKGQTANDARSEDLGVEIIDVRIRRADLPDENAQRVFQRMETERQQAASEERAKGQEAALQIRAEAERTRTVTLAEAQEEAEKIRGAGDAERNRIYASAYNQDAEFFAFYRSMLAYEAALESDTTLVLNPTSDFFRYFGSQVGGAGSGR